MLRLFYCVLAALCLGGALAAQTPDEYTLLRGLPTYPLSRSTGGIPNAAGLVGTNQSGAPAFVPDEQRGAIDSLVVGLALKGRGQISDAQCDTHVANGMLAIQATYDLQTASGNFSTRSDSITSTGGKADAMHFFLAWSNHGLWLLQQSPYAVTYSAQLAALRPKVEKAMDYLVANGSPDFTVTTSELKGDWQSANRSVINAAAFALGHRLLTGYSTQIRLDNYWIRTQGWLTNVFDNPNPSTGAPLFRDSDGIYLEKPPGNTPGYDTSYQGLANRFLLYILVNYPNAVVNGSARAARAARWHERRFLPDPNNSSLCRIDCTSNTRSGLGNQEGSTKTTDRPSNVPALLYAAAMYNQPDANVAAQRLAALPSVPAAEVTAQPPVIFSETTASATTGVPFSFTVLATNAGLDSLDPGYGLTIAGLPSWLTAGPLVHTKSTGSRLLSGTPPAGTPSGTVSLTITATNANGTGVPVQLVLNVLSPIEAWRQQKFQSTANTGIGADDADPDHDGISNLFEYALNLNPRLAGAAGIVCDRSSGVLRLLVQKNPAATDITYSVQATGDLSNPASWTTTGTTIEIDTPTTLQVRDDTPITSPGAHHFMRLHVTRP
ncbi:MAG: Ig domain-containing protein [Chthoniobacteraceae bacterium]